jgi:predicted permease
MPNDTDWKSRIRMAFGTQESVPEDDILEELAGHAQAMYEAARAEGCSHDQADSRANRQIECWRMNAAGLRRSPRRRAAIESPATFPSSTFAGLAQDFSYALRLLRRQWRYALLAIMTMALGIGATTLLFSVTYGVLVKPLPWPKAGRLVVLKETRGGRLPRFGSFTNAAYVAWREQMTNVEDIAAWSQRDVTLGQAGEPERIRVVFATASLFRVLGVRPLLGSAFAEKDETERVLVLSKSLWRERFSASPQAIGRVVQLDGQAYMITGVLDDTLAYPDQHTLAWAPMRVHPATDNFLSMFSAIAALRDGATPAAASAEGTARGRFAADSGMTTTAVFGASGPIEVWAQPLRDALTADVRRPLVVLLAAVGLMFAAATANVASLQLARATTRRREIAIRAALGAGSVRLARQLLVENLLIGFAGGGAGLAAAWWFHRLMPSLLPADFPRVGDLTVNVMVILFALVVSVVASMICGFLPALYVRRLHLVESLAEDGSATVGPGGRSRTIQARMLIMTAQVAVACMLLVGASLLARSFVALLNADRGYNPSGVLVARLSLPEPLYSPERRYGILSEILPRLAAAPGVAQASFTSELPLTSGGSTAALQMISPRADGGVITVQASPRIVSPQYFHAMGMRILQGRDFVDSDTQTSLPVAIVNRSFARRYLGDAALGATLPMGVGYGDIDRNATIVGVVDDVRYLSPVEVTQPEIYYSYLQLNRRLVTPVLTLVLHAGGNPAEFVSTIRAALRQADNNLAPDAIFTLEERILRGLARPRLYAILLGGFAAFALIVAGVGLFGVLSYVVAQRSRELALRTALGARQIDLVKEVLRQGLAVAIAGLAVGLLGSVALTRSIAAMLYGVTPHDVITYLVVPPVLLSVAMLASLAPAVRAARIDPIRLLKA